ncbi:YtxH domain-containing protein [Parasediminibacterium paludis]|uniref:YtxH domain-containing protein n=1 Tax=Parasediminibacterium paludis TaxID=908966 RepID=A0ABV8PYM7_9BACT
MYVKRYSMSNKKFLGGLILGAAAGAAIALFLSSDKGKKLMADAKHQWADLGDELDQFIHERLVKLDEMEAKISEA